jgi:hypothetical protein
LDRRFGICDNMPGRSHWWVGRIARKYVGELVLFTVGCTLITSIEIPHHLQPIHECDKTSESN